jgi:hypothetical protein
VVDPVVKSEVFNSVGEAALLPEEVGGPVPIVAGSVEEPQLPAKDIEQDVIVAVKLLAGEPATDAPESDFPVDPAVEEIPPVESESVEEPQKTEVVDLPVPSEKLAAYEVEPEEVSPATSAPIEAEQEVPTSDVPQEVAQASLDTIVQCQFPGWWIG